MSDKSNNTPDNTPEKHPPARQSSLPLSWDEKSDSKNSSQTDRKSQKNLSSNKQQNKDKAKNGKKSENSENKPRRRISLVSTMPDSVSRKNPNDQSIINESENNSQTNKKQAGSVKTQKPENTAGKSNSSVSYREMDEMTPEDKNPSQEANENSDRYQTPSDSPAPGLGQTLAQARMKRQLTITDVVRKTRITKEFIDNIEAEDYDKLPPPVYTRSHIAQLCREYSLEPKLCLRMYEQTRNESPGADKKNKKMRLVINRDNDDRGVVSCSPGPSSGLLEYQEGLSSRLPRLAIIFAAGLLLLIIFSALLIQHCRNLEIRQPAPVNSQENNPDTPVKPTANLEELIPPQHVPMKELSIPEE